MKTLLFFLIFSSAISFLYGQKLDKAFDYYKTGDYNKAKEMFNKMIDKGKDVPAAKFGLAMIIIDKDNKMGFGKAYYLLGEVKQSYKKILDNKRNEYRQYGLTVPKIDSLRNYILTSEYRRVRASENINKIDLFIRTYRGTAESEKMNFFKDSLVFANACNNNTVKDYDNFIQLYPNSSYLSKAIETRDSMWKAEYRKAYHSLEFSEIHRFDSLYPNYPFYDDSTLFYENLAIQFEAMKIYKGYNPHYVNYYSKFIKQTAPHELAFQTLLCLIQPALDTGNTDAAIDTVTKYKSYFKSYKKISVLLNILKNPLKVKVRKLPPSINTSYSEYLPIITTDGKTLYFCANEREDGMGGEDIFVSHKNGKIWGQSYVLREISTAKKNDAPMSISADGNTLYIFTNGDIFYVKKTAYGWSNKKPVDAINTKYWEADAFITADGNAILFSSDRPGNIGDFHPVNHHYHGDYEGNLDIYVIEKQKNGKWSKPINLGNVINTPYAERSPFLHPDMKTLYFSSDGHTGVGKLDVFKSVRLSDTSWTMWSKPVNLGYGINTSGKDYAYKITTDGSHAYFSQSSHGQSDIYTVELPKNDRPNKVMMVYGFVTDTSGKPMQASVVWENLSSGQTIGKMSSEPKTGFYTIALPLNKNYGIYVTKDRYYPVSANINLKKNPDSLQMRLDFTLYSINEIKDGMSIPLNNLFFDFDRANLKKESYPELNRLADFLKQYPDLKIEVSGHTDSIGDVAYNKKLSQKRAEAVKQYLISRGCNPAQINAVGYGSEKPLESNETAEGRRKNRRVEFKVIK